MYTRTFRTTCFLVTLSVAGAWPAGAASKQEVCSYYGNVGAAAINFLLPLKFSQVVDLVAGKDPALLEQMSAAVEKRGSPKVRADLEKTGKEALELIGEAAGYHAFQLTLTGQATDGQEVFGRLNEQCMNMGPDAIIESQRRARAVQQGE